MTIAIYVASVALGLVSLGLFVVAIRRLVGEQTNAVTAMLERYDDRLATLTQTIQQAIETARLPAGGEAASVELEALEDEAEDAQGTVVRALERARAGTATDAAVAIVPGTDGSPTATTVGLTEEEAADVTRMGPPDYRGARALEISYNRELGPEDGEHPIRSGLSVPLLESSSMLAVLTRAPHHQFSDADVELLRELADAVRPAFERALEAARQVERQPDMLADLLDRQTFYSLGARELAQAREASAMLSLLLVDVDGLSTNNHAGQPAGDGVLEEIARRLRHYTAPDAFLCRLEGGRFGALLSGSDGRAADDVFARLRASLADLPPAESGDVSVAGGVAELLPADTPWTLLERAETALQMARNAGAGTVVSTTPH